MNNIHVGGTFAPPLSDEKLATYKATIQSMPESPEKDAMAALMKCCDRWWNMPEPSGTAKIPHQITEYATVGETGEIKMRQAPMQVMMQTDHVTALDDDIPWRHELDAMAVLFDGLDREAVERNSQKIGEWTRAVIEHITAKHFTDPSLYSSIMRALRLAADWLGLVSKSEQDRFNERVKKAQECEKEIRLALHTKNYPPIPRPVLESTATRDAAHHLLWHVRELYLDREPITTDKL